MTRPFILCWAVLSLCLAHPSTFAGNPWRIVAREDNDLVRVLIDSGAKIERFDEPESAVRSASPGSGVLILADFYPKQTTTLRPDLFPLAAKKQLRLYVEYPSFLPKVKLGTPKTLKTGSWGNILERAVVTSDVFGERLRKDRIMMIHDCHYLPVELPVEVMKPHLVVAHVAGYDEAVYGVPPGIPHPVLFEHPNGEILVGTTKLSQFVTGRYAPADAWQPVWQMILRWSEPDAELPSLRWQPPVRPSFFRYEQLPADVERTALRRGAEWYRKSGLLVHSSWQAMYERPSNQGPPTPDWPDGHRAAPGAPSDAEVGDGRLGLLEGFRSKIYFDGRQSVLWWRRADNVGESAGALALAGFVLEEPAWTTIGANLAEWLTTKSRLYNGDFADPQHPAFGLAGWNDVARYYGEANGYDQIWGDDNARAWLGLLRAAAALRTDKFDERLAQQLIAMLRLTGPSGFIDSRIEVPKLAASGWKPHFSSNSEDLSPHYQAYVQACLLWGARATGAQLMRERATRGIRRMMDGYPNGWSATNEQVNQSEPGCSFLSRGWFGLTIRPSIVNGCGV